MWWSSVARAAEPMGIGAIEELPLVELLSLRSDVATRTDEEVRVAPGVITVLTAEDLRRAGCRDLLDALRLVPGLEFGTDVLNTVGLAVRGTWAAEGRVLVLIDGHVWNELNYGTFTLGNRLPVANIDRIEVIRGPGSAIYGGLASLAVVKVTTRVGGEGLGTVATGQRSWLSSGQSGRTTGSVAAAWSLGPDTRLALGGVLGTGRRMAATHPYEPVRADPQDLSDGSDLDPALANAQLDWRGLQVAALAEQYHTTHRDAYVGLVDRELDNDFTTVTARARWEVPLDDAWTLTPRASFGWQEPWESSRDVPTAGFLDTRDQVDRTAGGADLRWVPSAPVDLLGGVTGGVDRGHVPVDQPGWYFPNGTRHQVWGFGSAFVQVIGRSRWVNGVGGLRYDLHQAYGSAVAPRLALTHTGRHGHLKLLGSRAFHAPTMVPSRSDVGPEWTTTVEAEGGLGAGPVYATLGAYEVQVSDVLLYFYDPTSDPADGYRNGGAAGTRGLEGDVVLRWRSVQAGLGGAVGVPNPNGDTPDYRVPGQPRAVLGLPGHKVVGRVSGAPGPVVVGGVATVLGPRWAIPAVDGAGSRYERLPASVLLDATVEGVEHRTGLRVGVSAHDLLDTAAPFVQPYDGWHGALPSLGREILVTIGAGEVR